MRSVTSIVYLFVLGGLAAPKLDLPRFTTLVDKVFAWRRLGSREASTTPPSGLEDLEARQTGWNPPAALAKPLKEVWDRTVRTHTNIWTFKNYGWDQLQASKGVINYCVRWDSSKPVSEALRAQIATELNTQSQKWFSCVYNWDNFPFRQIKVNVVSWAVRDKNLLQGSTAGIDVSTDKDDQGIPQCPQACGRFFHQMNDYDDCPGRSARHYDQSLWLSDGMNGGAGGDWGQRMGSEFFLGMLGSPNIHVFLHEMGHTYGLDDFYDWMPTGPTNFIMNAGSSMEITEFDKWMYRNWCYVLSRRRGWQAANKTKGPPGVIDD